MLLSEIVIPQNDIDEQDSTRKIKLRSAYQNERDRLEVIEVELNRSKVVIMDDRGKIRYIPIIAEH